MVRTQIQLTEQQAASLRALSSERRQPVAELIRISIDSFLQKEKGLRRENRIARAKRAAGRFASSAADVSAKHDQYLAAAFGRK
jgi:Arc/MetJ-type ribon-helix-helix transcriptional regulator